MILAPSTHPRALMSNPPDVFFSPPKVLVSPPSPLTHMFTIYDQSQATKSAKNITSPLLVIPGHEPITTTLTPQQLSDLMPTLHIYIHELYPAVALLPAASLSYNGVQKALRWREADDAQYQGIKSDLVEFIEIYQALAYLGNNPNSHNLVQLDEAIRAEISQGLHFSEVQKIWDLRHLPFTEHFITAMMKQLVIDYKHLGEEETCFYGLTTSDAMLAILLADTHKLFEWIGGEKELRERFKCTQARMELETKRAKRNRRMAMALAMRNSEMSTAAIISTARRVTFRRAPPRLITISC